MGEEGGMKALHVINWDSHHETADSRKYQALKYVAKPNKHDGLSYRRLVKQTDRTDLYAAWSLILEVASKSARGQRGWLVRDGSALTATDMEVITGFPEGIFTRAFEFFMDPQIGWLEETECKCLDSVAVPKTTAVGDSPSAVGDSPSATGATRTPGTSALSLSYLSNQSHLSPPEGNNKKGGRAMREAVTASRTQWAALNARVQELRRRGEELDDEERLELEEKERALAVLTERQQRGQF